MRLVVGIIGTACLCGMSLAQANPPSSASAPEAATPPSTQSATQAAPAPTSSAPATPSQPAPAKDARQTVVVEGTPEYDALEKHFLSEGYKLEMRGGQKVLCRREEEIGSRLGGRKVCATTQELMVTERDAQRSVDRNMMQQNNPSGK
jgi:hypothetical protein